MNPAAWWRRVSGRLPLDSFEPIKLRDGEESVALLHLLSIHQQTLAEIRQMMQTITYRTITLFAVVMGLVFSTAGTFTRWFALPLVAVAFAALWYLGKQQVNYIRVYGVVQRIDQRLGCHKPGNFGHDGPLYTDWNKVHAAWWWAMKAHALGIIGFCGMAIAVALCRDLFMAK